MNLINELESNARTLLTWSPSQKLANLTEDEINQALTYYKKAGYHFTIPQTRQDKLSLISDITYVSSKDRKGLQDALRYLRSKSGQYRTNLKNSTADLRTFLFKNTCRFSEEVPRCQKDLTKLAVVYSLTRQELQKELKALKSHPETAKYLVGVKLNQKTIKLREILVNLTSNPKSW